MSAARHTRGPWVTGNTDPLLFGRQQGNGTEPIGFVYGPSFPENSEYGRTCLANARLIASAPDLLNALQLYLAHSPEPECAVWRDVQGRARAAIAKATGDAE